MNQENANQPGEPQHLRVVVLDDEDVIRELLKVLLHSMYQGIEIAEVADGNAAWDELSRQTPDLLITDYKHPGMRCEELLTRLAGMKNPCPAVLTSGYDETQVSDELAPTFPGLSLNVEFVAKPYNPEQMKAVLAKHLGPAGSADTCDSLPHFATEIGPERAVSISHSKSTDQPARIYQTAAAASNLEPGGKRIEKSAS
jgi:CheY-like chemotaxis protein